MKRKPNNKTIKTGKRISRPPSINPFLLNGSGRKRETGYSADDYITGILSGDRIMLSRAITLVESSLPDHRDTICSVVEGCLPYSGNSVRIGITGIPGVGKSTYIESFGLYLTALKKRVAVLTVDPTSKNTKGSILGDKTRMEKLGNNPDAFIRPSPSAGTPGGVAKKTRETIILCEAAGFNTVIVETVGVGQSETSVHGMVDFFLLLMLAGAGDELQGIKRGIIEIADAIIITKADGQNVIQAERARDILGNSIHMFPLRKSGLIPEVFTCSAFENKGIKELWKIIEDYVSYTRQTGYFEERRKTQAIERMYESISDYLHEAFYKSQKIKSLIPLLEKQLLEGRITSYKAASDLIDMYEKSK